jgi:tetratricopeptide (TPR) repeat protein
MIAYLPASRAGFVWDDDAYVTDNPLMAAPDGMRKIWFSGEHPSQYFPLAYTTLRLGYDLWGLDPAGYHVVNIIEHCVNALLVWVLLRKLGLPGAWLGAALFALHPVQVETVAWISELKNLQSTLFYLLALLMWVKFTEKIPAQQWRFYALSLLFFLLSLLSKTTACTLPAALLLVLWLRHRPIGWRTLLEVVPFCLFSLGMGLFSIWWERRMGHYGAEFGLSFSAPERLLIAGRAIWFYAAKLLWPASLTFSYPRWNINSHDFLQYGWVLASVLCGVLLWRSRRWWGRGPVTAVLFFVATLSPMLGLVQNFTFRYSFVADHYQYLACLGPLALFAAGASNFLSARWPAGRGLPALSAVLLLTLASLTWRQCGAYKDLETIMRDTIAKNPESWMSHANLGLCYLQRGQTKEAIACFERAVRLNPNCFEAIRSLGLAMAAEGRFDEALQKYQDVLKINPNDFGTYNNIGLALCDKGLPADAVGQYVKAIEINPAFLKAHVNLAITLQRLGRGGEAVAHYKAALGLDPRCPEALNNLAWILATHPDAAVRDGAEALRLATEALQTSPSQDALNFVTLAAAYAENGSFTQAVAAARKAEELASAPGTEELAKKYHDLTVLFLSGQPLRDAPRTAPRAQTQAPK